MKPVGLRDPRTGRPPYAVVQLRQENLRADSYNLVGFQNHLKFGEQARVLRLIPGLENARFLRYGQIHRNTYINAPTFCTTTLQMKSIRTVLFAGQICGVEGYVESIATGLMAGVHAAALATGASSRCAPPRPTAFGSLMHYVTQADPRRIFSRRISRLISCRRWRSKVRDRKQRHRLQCDGWRCTNSMRGWSAVRQPCRSYARRTGLLDHRTVPVKPRPSGPFAACFETPSPLLRTMIGSQTVNKSRPRIRIYLATSKTGIFLVPAHDRSCRELVQRTMILRDLIRDVFRTLWAHKLRTFLTMFGIAWGVVSIVLMMAAGEGLRVGQAKQRRNSGQGCDDRFPRPHQPAGWRATRRAAVHWVDTDLPLSPESATECQYILPELEQDDSPYSQQLQHRRISCHRVRCPVRLRPQSRCRRRALL